MVQHLAAQHPIATSRAASHAGSFTREMRALAVTVYFGSASALWLYDSIHLAIIMLQAGQTCTHQLDHT